MVWFILAHIFRILVAFISVSRLSDLKRILSYWYYAISWPSYNEKPNQIEKLTLAILTAKLQQVTQRPS